MVEIDLGKITGPRGPQGEQGPQGEPGPQVTITSTINASSLNNEVPGAKAVWDLVMASMSEEY